MKSTCYISGGNLWFNGRAFGWKRESLKDIFKAAKKDKGIDEIRLVLGREMSFVVAVRIDALVTMTREKAMKLAEVNLPFVPVDKGFDWELISLGEGDVWIQIAAIEPGMMKVLVEATKSAGIKILDAIPAALVLARASLDHDAPVLIKWQEKEKISVLGIKGLVDYVGADEDEKINAYARHKWHLAVNPEQLVLGEEEFDFQKELDAIRRKGDDAQVMGIDIGKEEVRGFIQLDNREVGKEGVSLVMENETVWRRWVRVVGPVAVVVVLVTTFVIFAFQLNRGPVEPVEEVTVSPTFAPEVATESSQVGEPADITVQILNGSGVIGEAARVRDELTALGFTDIDIGNSPPLVRTEIAYKGDVSAEVLSAIVESLSEFEIGNLFSLTSENKYDVIVTIGTTRKE